MDEELSLEEFLHPDIFKWMNTDIVLDSEHAATVESNAETMGMPHVVINKRRSQGAISWSRSKSNIQ